MLARLTRSAWVVLPFPDECRLGIERRLIPGETKEDVQMEMQSLLGNLSEGDLKFKADYEITVYREPMETSPKQEICELLKEETIKTLDRESNFVGGSG